MRQKLIFGVLILTQNNLRHDKKLQNDLYEKVGITNYRQ